MKRFLNKLTGSDDKPAVREKQVDEEIEAARRRALGQEASPPGYGGQQPPAPPRGGPPPGGPPSGSGLSPPPGLGQGPPPAPGAGVPFAPPGAEQSGSSLTPDSERREITSMALEDLQERRRAPTDGAQLEGVPPPEIPSEVLRDQALQEILQRKERIDREWRQSQGMPPGQPADPDKPYGSLKKRRKGPPPLKKALKKKAPPRAAAAEAEAPEAAPAAEAVPVAEASAPEASAPPAAPRKAPKKKLKLRPLKSDPEPELEEAVAVQPEERVAAEPSGNGGGTDGPEAEEALVAIKGVGPKTGQALLERFSSLEEIKEADVEDLTEVSGVGPALAARIKSDL